MNKLNYEVEVLVNGRPVKEYYKDGQVYIEGRVNQRFQLRIRNNSYQRIVVIPTIDGLSVLDGQEATPDSTGYVISGHSSLTIDGWRKSDKEVAEFYFSAPGAAYSVRLGKGLNLGVIGVAVFRELEQYTLTTTHINSNGSNWRWWYEAGSTSTPERSASYAGSHDTVDYHVRGEAPYAAELRSASLGSMDTPSGNHSFTNSQANAVDVEVKAGLGTGWGDTRRSEVIEVAFEREKHPDAIFELFYNTRENLEKLGVDFASRPTYVAPRAFPQFPSKYCEPPR